MTNWKRTFLLIWVGQAVSMIGSQMVGFAIAWWLTKETGSAAVLVTMAIFGTIPGVVLGPFIGALVDRWNRQRVMILADTIIALMTLWLAVMFWSGNAQIWFLYLAAFVRGTLGIFHYTAMTASTSLMVPEQHLARVGGMNQTLQGVLNIATPPLGALVVSLLPIWGVMFIDVVTAVLAVLPLFFVRIPQPKNVSGELVTPKLVLRDVRAGLHYVLGWPGLMMILAMATLINFLLAPASVLMPLLVDRYFHGTAWHLSAAESAFGFGMIGGGLVLSLWGGFKRRILTSMLSLIAMGTGALITGLAPSTMFWIVIVGFAINGFFNPLVNGSLMAIMQVRVQPEMQGRVFTLISTVASAMTPVGMALAAPVADTYGVQVWWQIGGVMCILMGLVGLIVPAIAYIERDQKHGVVTSAAPAVAD